jgi:hypothetical protein
MLTCTYGSVVGAKPIDALALLQKKLLLIANKNKLVQLTHILQSMLLMLGQAVAFIKQRAPRMSLILL